MSKQQVFNFRTLLYLASFVEGGALMAAELLGAKMMAPFFGSSLYVWSAILGVTLGALAVGYFTGGNLSSRYKSPKTLYYLMLMAGGFLILMPYSSKSIMSSLYDETLFYALITSCIVFLFPPVFLMGTLSPMIISQLSTDRDSGKTAGRVYAISTAGGILGTFFIGFYAIPAYGLATTAISAGCLLALIPFIVLLSMGNSYALFFLFPLLLIFNLPVRTPDESSIRVIDREEGLLGQITVVDYTVRDTVDVNHRLLLFNNVIQTAVDTSKKNTSQLKYVDIIKKIVRSAWFDSIPPKALLLGLGGGSVAAILKKNKFEIDAVEFDERVVRIAKEYFRLPEEVNVTIADARYFIRHSKKKYDLIIIDVFKGEETPNHIITLESLAEIKEILHPKGLLIINGNGFLEGDAGRGTRSIIRTLKTSGFIVNIFPTEKEEAYRNLVFTGQLYRATFSKGGLENIPLTAEYVPGAEVLRDDKPVLDLLNMQASKSWRTGYIKTSIRELDDNHIELFN